MLIPQFMQARRLARDDENLLASFDDGRKIINKLFESSAKSFIMAEVLRQLITADHLRWNAPTQAMKSLPRCHAVQTREDTGWENPLRAYLPQYSPA